MADEDAPPKEIVVSWSLIWVTAVVCLAQSFVFYGFFAYQRSKEANNESYSLYEPRQFRKKHRSPKPFASSWWREAWNVEQEELLRCVGLDTYMFLRFLRLAARTAGMGTLLSLVLIPLYATGNASGNSTLEFNQLTLARVEEGSPRMWATVFSWWIFVAFVLYEIWTEWELYAINRSRFLAVGDPDTPRDFRYAIRVEQLPKALQTDQALKRYFERIFPGKVCDASIYWNISELQQLCDERQKAIEAVEKVAAFAKAKPDKPAPQLKVGGMCGGTKVDAIKHFSAEIDRLNVEVDAKRSSLLSERGACDEEVKAFTVEEPMDQPNTLNDESETSEDGHASSSGMVTFTSLRVKQAAIQCELNGKSDSISVFPAADPEGILWNNITIGLHRQRVLGMWASALWLVGILFWAVPVSFVTGIANLNSLLETFGLPQADSRKAWYGLVAGLLPVIFLAILMAVLLMAIEAAARLWIRYKSVAEVDAYTLYWHQLFQFANLWLILLGGSLFGQLDSLLNNPENIVQVIADALPGASVFFFNMISVGGLGNFGMELSMLPTYGVTLILQLLQPEAMRTQRMLDAATIPPSIKWASHLPKIVFIFLVTVIYCPIVPLMEVAAFVYFGGTYMVWKHQCLHVYSQSFEGGGMATWQSLFGFLMACLFMAECVVIAYLGLKKAPGPAGCAFVPLIVSILFYFAIKRNLIKPLENLSLEAATTIDDKDGELNNSTATSINDQLYAQPALKTIDEEREPYPYRRNDEDSPW